MIKQGNLPRSKPARGPARRRVFIVDDHPITRYGLRQLLDQEPDLAVCGEAPEAGRAFAAIKPPLPDLVVADLGMPGKSVIEFVKDLRAVHPEVPVLILSTYEESVYAERLVRAGARGYIMKTEGGASLLKAIRQLLGGQPYLSQTMAAQLFDVLGGRPRSSKTAALGRLSDREFEVFQCLGQGKTNRQVAEQLCISPKTVEAHRLNLCRKLDLKTPGQLIRYAVQHLESHPRPA